MFAPKYRRQIVYKQISADIGQIIRALCARKGIEILEAAAMPDHVHLCKDTAEVQRVRGNGMPEGKEQPDEL